MGYTIVGVLAGFLSFFCGADVRRLLLTCPLKLLRTIASPPKKVSHSPEWTSCTFSARWNLHLLDKMIDQILAVLERCWQHQLDTLQGRNNRLLSIVLSVSGNRSRPSTGVPGCIRMRGKVNCDDQADYAAGRPETALWSSKSCMMHSLKGPWYGSQSLFRSLLNLRARSHTWSPPALRQHFAF